LIVIIIAASIYAVEIGSSNLLYEPEPAFSEADLISPETEYSAGIPVGSENVNTAHRQTYESPEYKNSLSGDSVTEDPEENADPESKPAEKPEASSKNRSKKEVAKATKAKPKVKAKPKRNHLSNEELVKRKLKQGKTVRQIADETGLDRKYVREVKRRTQQIVW
jgi:hypothetical protein